PSIVPNGEWLSCQARPVCQIGRSRDRASPRLGGHTAAAHPLVDRRHLLGNKLRVRQNTLARALRHHPTARGLVAWSKSLELLGARGIAEIAHQVRHEGVAE